MAGISIRFDQQDMAYVNKLFASADTLYNRVAYRAMAKVVGGVKTDTDAGIRSVYNLKKASVTKKIFTTKGNQSAPNFSVQVGKHMDESSRTSTLISYIGTRAVKSGVSVKVLTMGQRKIISHAFSANAKTATNIFMRQYRQKNAGPYNAQSKKIPYARLPKKFRLPVSVLRGPKLASAFDKDVTLYKTIKDQAVDRMKKEVEYQMDMALKNI